MRLKIIAGNLVAVLLLGLLSYTIIRGRVESEVVSDIDKHIRDDQTLFDRSWRLSAIEFLENVRDRAGTTAMRDVFAGLDVTSRRTRAFEAAEVVARWFADPARGRGGAPDLVVITDETGRVIARNADRNRMFDAQLSDALPALRTALQGNAVHDVWRFVADGKVLQTGIAPIRNDRGTLLGALVVGYDISNGVARSEAQVLGRDVAFLTSDKVYSSSLPGPAAEALKAYLFGAARAQTMAALGANRTPSQTWVTKLGDSEYVGVTAPLPHSTTENAGYVVLANRTEALQTASAVNVILLLTLLFAVAVVGYGMVIGTSFLRPIEQIEEGVLAVINGRTDLRLDIESTELGGLAYRINQLLNVFTGVTEGEQEEDDEGRVSRPPLAPPP